MRLLRIVPDDTKFDFMRFRRISFPLSALLSILAISLYFFHGLNFGIDFRGGTLLEVRQTEGVADLAKMRATIATLGLGEAQLQQFGGPSEVLIRIAEQPGGDAAQQQAVTKVKAALGTGVEYRRTEVVGPRVSGELVQSGTLGVVLSIIAVLTYLWFRYEWPLAVAAVIATMHDLLLTVGFFAVTQLEFNLTSIAAILTIVRLSLNETVVVLDRIREIMRKYKKAPMAEIIDLSINAVLSRTIMTSTTTLIALLALVFFGGHVIRSFSLAMMWGVIVAMYSSIFICSPVLIYLNPRSVEGEAEAAPAKAGKAKPAV